MRFIALLLAGCASNAPSTPPSPSPSLSPSPSIIAPTVDAAPVTLSSTCVPIGTWMFTIHAGCAQRPERLPMTVHAGAPDARDPKPLWDVLDPIVASGHSTTNGTYERLMRITNAKETANGCEMDMHMEYVGPHEAIEYKATLTLSKNLFRGKGTYTYLVEDCKSSDPSECTCESELLLYGDAH